MDDEKRNQRVQSSAYTDLFRRQLPAQMGKAQQCVNPGFRILLKQFPRENIGRIVTSSEFREATGGVSEWARRVRGLRDEEGWSILTHRDCSDLTQGQYRLSEAPTERPDLSFDRAMSAKVRAQVPDRNGFTCQMCGLTPGKIDPSTGQDEQRVVFQWLRK